jgi:hypothetical protein
MSRNQKPYTEVVDLQVVIFGGCSELDDSQHRPTPPLADSGSATPSRRDLLEMVHN